MKDYAKAADKLGKSKQRKIKSRKSYNNVDYGFKKKSNKISYRPQKHGKIKKIKNPRPVSLWLVCGVVIGLFLAFLLFLQLHKTKSHQEQAANKVVSQYNEKVKSLTAEHEHIVARPKIVEIEQPVKAAKKYKKIDKSAKTRQVATTKKQHIDKLPVKSKLVKPQFDFYTVLPK